MNDVSEDSAERYLTLADWRRQVAALYTGVRRLAADDPVAAWDEWRQARERLYREHPQSPVPTAQRAAFRARHFAFEPALRFEVAVEPDPDAEANAARLPASTGDGLLFHRIGWVDIPFRAGGRRLALFWLAGYAGGLFLPF